jgi:hypothetical protein
VFEQSYTRFLDLQKAEAQAREAQIEAALERVRSRTMAMHKSSELIATAELLFDQLKQLGAELQGVAFSICDKNSVMVQKWTSIGVFSVPYTIEPGEQRMYEAWKNQVGIYEEVYEGERQKKYYELFLEIPAFKQGIQKFIDAGHPIPTWQKNHAVTFKHGYLLLITTKPFDETQIFLRFGKVFEQTYTRFLDLQKAEAQAREAQIELGLERVRAKAMAMQNSDELNGLIGSVFTELTKLDLMLTRCVIQIYEGSEKGCRWWMANSEAPSMPMNFFVKHADMPFFNEYLKAWQERTLKWQYILEGKNKIKTDDFLFTETGLSELPDFVIAGMKAPDRVYLNASFNNFGNLTLASLEPLSDEHFDILLRFAKVFDLTYTRFNDLKQAETQAREAQIQLALERVRARSMAMQKSDELPETAAILFEQFKSLGQELMQMTIGIVNEHKGVIEFNVTDWSGGGGGVKRSFDLSIEEPTLIHKMYTGWKENKKSIVVDLAGKELEGWINYRNKMSGVNIWSADTGGRRVITCAFFSKGHLSFSTPVSPDIESIRVLERFAQVFDLSYTRFLDLQKAEAQARESQIQLALERVRARTMAMQKSDELAETVSIVFKQLLDLGVKSTQMRTCAIVTLKPDEPIGECWITNPEGNIITQAFTVIYDEASSYRPIYNAWKRREKFFVLHLSGEALATHLNYLKKYAGIPTQQFLPSADQPMETFTHALFFSQGYLLIISNEHLTEYHEIFKRLGTVFQQTYTRFLDLQKAEAQAREAQIEAALERVRSRTMGMQRSEELKEAAQLLFQQVQTFGVDQWACGYNIWEPDGETCVAWMSRQGTLQPPFKTSFSVDPCFRRFYDAKQRGEVFYVEEMGGDEIKAHYKRLLSLPEFKSAPQEFFDEFIAPEFQIFHIAHFSQGYLMFIT